MAERILKSFWSSARADNHTTATDKGEEDARAAGYSYIRDEAIVWDSPQPGTVPLELYWSPARGDNFTTATAEGIRDAKAAGYTWARTEGYVYSSQQPGTVPLKLFWHPTREDNFTTASAQGENDALVAGYRFVRNEAYVKPPVEKPAVTRWPIIQTATWKQSAMSMAATITLSKNGQLFGWVNTRSTWWAKGFTGGAVILILDADNRVLWSLIRQYGVDGTATSHLPGAGASNRTDYIFENLGDVASNAYRIVVGLSHMPKNRLKSIVDKITEGVKTVADGVKEIAEYVS